MVQTIKTKILTSLSYTISNQIRHSEPQLFQSVARFNNIFHPELKQPLMSLGLKKLMQPKISCHNCNYYYCTKPRIQIVAALVSLWILSAFSRARIIWLSHLFSWSLPHNADIAKFFSLTLFHSIIILKYRCFAMADL